MVRAFSFAHVELINGTLQMRLILDRMGLRHLPSRLADRGGKTSSGKGMQRGQNAVTHSLPSLLLPIAIYSRCLRTSTAGSQGSEGTDLADQACSKTAPSWQLGRHRRPDALDHASEIACTSNLAAQLRRLPQVPRCSCRATGRQSSW